MILQPSMLMPCWAEDQHARELPWRARSPELAPAYHVFLSELMLQQTVVATVIPYFNEFIRRWPDIHALAAADEDDVLRGGRVLAIMRGPAIW